VVHLVVRPRNKWLDQLRNESTRPIGDLCRRAVHRLRLPCGNGGDCPGEKHLIGRCPGRNWTRFTISSLFSCRKLQLFLGKSTKTAATRAALFDSNMHQMVCRLGLRLRPHWGRLQRSPRSPSCIKVGLLSFVLCCNCFTFLFYRYL